MNKLERKKNMQITNHQINGKNVELLSYFGLARPLLVAKATNGLLACGYINPSTCDKTTEACAIVSGVNNFDEMKTAKVVAVSQVARDMGVEIGDLGEVALSKMG